jgi:hypothetical protein
MKKSSLVLLALAGLFLGCQPPETAQQGEPADGTLEAQASTAVAKVTLAQYQTSFNAFLSRYAINSGDFKTSLTETGAIHFWEAAFIRQLLVENYRLTGLGKDKITETYYRFENTHSTNRFGNARCWIINDSDWNDDYSWQSQFAISAYAATGDQHMLDQAKWHFDYFYSNNVDNTWDGGMWRERGVRNQKDIPTNGYAIVAIQLARYYPNATVHNNLTNTDRTYLQITQDIYSWIKVKFLRTDGGVKNSISSGNLGWDDNLYTYNAGIFLELAAHLYDITRDTTYLADAVKVANYARVRFTSGPNQVVVYEDDVGGSGLYRPDGASSYEVVFKGILLRGVYKLITLGGQTQYADWLGNNAEAAYRNRSSDNLTAPQFDTPFGSNARATGVASGLTAMAYHLMTSTAGNPTPYYRIKNRWTGDYLHLEGKTGKVQYGPLQPSWLSMKWVLEDVGDGYKRIKNLWTNDYLHIENLTGAVQYGSLNSAWHSMQWSFPQTGDSTYFNIKSRWSNNPHLMHSENGLGWVQAGAGQADWFSAQWVFEPTN